jgi:hypothetical protein
MIHFQRNVDGLLVEMTEADIAAREASGTAYYSATNILAHVAWTDAEIATRKAEEAAAAEPKPLPLDVRLTAIYEAAPLELQADFAALRTAVKDELAAGRVDIAKLIIQRATIPAELEQVRTALLAEFEV